MNLITVSHYDFGKVLEHIHKNDSFSFNINDYQHYLAFENFLLFYLNENLDDRYLDDVKYILSESYLEDVNEPVASLTFESRKIIRSNGRMSHIYALDAFNFIKPNGKRRFYQNLIRNNVTINRDVHVNFWDDFFD